MKNGTESNSYKSITVKAARSFKTKLLTLAVLFITAILCLSACVSSPNKPAGNNNNMNNDTTPVKKSIDQLSFTPASPGKQVLTEKGRSPQIIITNYNETATDALGRTLPTSDEVGLPKKDKYVGLFYSLWTSEIQAPVDVSKVLAQNPDDPDYGARAGFCFWSEPETGYHKADEVWQIKRDLNYFAMAGVDFLYFDMTNGFLYADAMKVFLDTCLEVRAGGQMTPYIVPWCFATDAKQSHGDIGKFYEMFMTDEKYADLWFCWDGKPLALVKPTDDGQFPILDDDNFKDKLTFRKSWVGSGEMYWVDGGVFFGYSYGWVGDSTKAECIGIGTAGFSNFGSGRSGDKSTRSYLNKFLETKTMGEGITFEKTFNDVMQNNPECEVLLITRWNEWIAQNFTQDKPKPTDTGYVDEFNTEFSRDIEPMKGGFTDNYFYQMCSIIRRFKGVLPPDGNTGKQTVNIDGSFDQWKNIAPVFTDFEGDTLERDATDTTGKIHYVNKTGRNDIVESRMTADDGAIYFYARTASELTKPQDSKNWMLLFIDSDNDKSTGFEGYDYLVNYEVVSGKLTTLCEYKDNIWQEIGLVNYRAEGNELMIEIPRSYLGLTGGKFTVNFHWMDNVTDIYDLESWFMTGDSAPERRNNYQLSLDVKYDADAEKPHVAKDAPADRKPIAYMPALPFTFAGEESSWFEEGAKACVYKLTPNYGKMPEFRLIEDNLVEKKITGKIAADVFEGFTENFAADYEGCVKVSEDGNYTFTLTCDDCARLYVDGRLIAECAYEKRGADETVSARGSLRLAKGFHTLRVEYAEIKNGNPKLSLEVDGGALIMVQTGSGEFRIDLGSVKGTNGNPNCTSDCIEVRNYNTVLDLGEIDLLHYSKIEIVYGSDSGAMLGDSGSFFAVLESPRYVTPRRKTNVIGTEALMENATGESWMPDRVVEIDLSEITFSGEVYLGIYMGDTNGVNIYKITLS